MRDGFVKVAAVTIPLMVADCDSNTGEILSVMDEALETGAKVIVFPELCISGYTCGDLFWQSALLEAAKNSLKKIAEHTAGVKALIFVGVPLAVDGKLYNCAAAISEGRVIGLVPKAYLPTYNEYYESRQFTAGRADVRQISLFGMDVPFGRNLIFAARELPELLVSAEICEDLWVPCPPSTSHALAGATVIANLSASVELTGKSAYRDSLVKNQSARLLAAYIYASAGEGESSQDLVFSGERLICENGSCLAHSARFSIGITAAEIDVQRLSAERRRMTTFVCGDRDGYTVVPFSVKMEETVLTRTFDPHPFVPEDAKDRTDRCEEIFSIQALGLKKRLRHIHSRNAVIGISGGLDSTLALLVTVRAFDMLGIDRKGILAVTMPAFGTTDRTHSNAVSMVNLLGCTLKEINIEKAVMQHFSDIGHDPAVTDVTYENSQARERTQILMDLANQTGGIVIGTGDLSELALGWATYNGDHMSMYAVNVGVPKTLVRHLVRYVADTCGERELQATLMDVLDTPVSPELLPPKEGNISQITEDLVGPYELHDFFLYNMLRMGFPPHKILRIAKRAFAGTYSDETIEKWLRKFIWRFFSQQYKRSCIPDGPKVGSVAISPRGDLRMPSDAEAAAWIKDLG